VFTVTGSHAYAEDGSFSITVTIEHDSAIDTVANSTAMVADAALSATGVNISSTEGAAFSGVVATFTDADPNAMAGDFTATITWGDSNTSTGMITVNGSGGFNVTGSNTYAEEGSYAVIVTINDAGGRVADGFRTSGVGKCRHGGCGCRSLLGECRLG
jgi:hypothetical protein